MQIDSYTQEQFEQEKDDLKDIDGYTIIEYVKGSIEILMNMKIEDDSSSSSQLTKKKRGTDLDPLATSMSNF